MLPFLYRVSLPSRFRPLIQWGFLAWCVLMGVRFGLWYHGLFDPSRGEGFFSTRPAGVEGFLPVGALVSARHLLASGEFDPIHPAGLTLLLTFVGMSLVARRSFCSFICPAGTLSEALWKAGRKLFGRGMGEGGPPYRVWRGLDLPLRGLKYLLLAFFLKLVFLDLDPMGVAAIVSSPYEKVADIKMWLFFTRLSGLALAVFAALGVLSLLYQNFWCRYLCPYGALVGVAGLLSPWNIRRDSEACTQCGACSRACPSRLPVADRKVVRSAECTGCLTCVDQCPAPGALRMGLPPTLSPSKGGRGLPWWTYPVLVLALFALGVGAGMATGRWESALTPGEVVRAISIVEGGGF